MIRTAYRAAVFALYQTSIAAGILLLPVALLARRAGIPFPAHRVVTALAAAYDRTETGS